MKKVYTGLKAERVDFGSYTNVTTISLPAGCMQIVADVAEAGGNVCSNPSDTTQYNYLGDNPYGN